MGLDITAKSRYKARRAAKIAERRDDEALSRKVAVAASGCSDRVLKAVTQAPNWRNRAEPEFVTREDPEYRKVNNPYGQITNARQKMRGCLYRLKPEDAGVKVSAGETVNRWQLVAAVRKHYLEGK